MGKSIVIAGIDASVSGLGGVYDIISSWLLNVDKELMENNLVGSSYITSIAGIVWFGSNFNDGQNIFENKKINGVRLYATSTGQITLGVYNGETFTAKKTLDILSGYNEFTFLDNFLVNSGEFMAFKPGASLKIKANAKDSGFTYSGYNYTYTGGGSPTSGIFIDFRYLERIKLYDESSGYITAAGIISTAYGGKHYKYRLYEINKIAISGKIGVDPSGWALCNLYKTGKLIKIISSTLNEYDNYEVDVSDADEIWVNSQPSSLGNPPLSINIVE